MAGKKFRFSLESVLTLRRYETERAERRLGQVVRDRLEQEDHVRDMRHRLMSLPGVSTGAVDPVALRRQDAFREDARRWYEQACAELTARKHREGKARDQLRARRGAEESLQILHDQEKDEHRKVQVHTESAFLDEQAISGFLRKKRS